MSELESRLLTVEKALRFWKKLGSAVLCMGIIAAICGANLDPDGANPDSSKVVESVQAKRIEVVNGAGQVVFSASSDAAGGGAIRLNDENGNCLLIAGRGDFGHAGLTLCGRTDRPAIILRESQEGGGLVQVISKEMVPLVMIGSTEKTDGMIRISSANGAEIRSITPEICRHE